MNKSVLFFDDLLEAKGFTQLGFGDMFFDYEILGANEKRRLDDFFGCEIVLETTSLISLLDTLKLNIKGRLFGFFFENRDYKRQVAVI